jgi:glycosyltransferase involved in cell wall biosynthesis
VSAVERRARREAFALDPDRTTILSLGALVVEKGVDLAVDAVGALPDAQLLVVGDGPERRNLEARAQARAPGRVTFTGSIVDPRPAYEAADVVVLPSRGGDSMPAVLIEAGLTGIASVSTPVGGIPEIVVDGRTGVLVAPGELPPLVEALRRITADAGSAGALGRRARAHCLEHFGIDAVAAQWRGVLDAVAPVDVASRRPGSEEERA